MATTTTHESSPRPADRSLSVRAYLEDPAEIYRASFRTIAAEAPLETLPEALRPLAARLIHASGMTDLVPDLAFSADAVAAGQQALAGAATILVDARMVMAGITDPRARLVCILDAPEVAAHAAATHTTRSAAGMELACEQLGGAVVAIGNAPTALFRLLELIARGAPRPALILGFPVGFVGAAEAKQALAESDHGVPFVTLAGRRGGSAMAAAAVNALFAGLP